MALLINQASPAGSDSPTLGDDQVRALKLAIQDIWGVPDNTTITNAVLAINSTGLQYIKFNDLAGSPAASGRLSQNGASLEFHDGTAARVLLEASAVVASNRIPYGAGTALLSTSSTFLFNGSILFVNDSANGSMTQGVTINQLTATNEILSLKQSNLAHGVTVLTETDTFTFFEAESGASGGGRLSGVTAASVAGPAFRLRGLGGTAVTSASTSTYAHTLVEGLPVSGTDVTNAAANELIFGVRTRIAGGTRALFFVDAEGDLFVDGSTTPTAFDAWDDVALIRAFDHERTPSQIIRSVWDDHVRYHRADLVRAGILSDPQDGGEPMVNITQLQRLHNGAIWQLSTQLRDTQQRLRHVESRLTALQPSSAT